MKFVQTDDVRNWFVESRDLAQMTRSIGASGGTASDRLDTLNVPVHLQFVIEKLAEESDRLSLHALDSLPFYSLCRGVLLPLSHLTAERSGRLFGIHAGEPLDAAGREALADAVLARDMGLSVREKLGCLLGDPFLGGTSRIRRDSLIRLLMSLRLTTRRECLERLTRAGDISVLFAEGRPLRCPTPPLTAAEVLRTLRYLGDTGTRRRFEVLRSLYSRCGRLEAYFLTRLLLRKAGFGSDFQGPLVARVLARSFRVSESDVSRAMALTDAFQIAKVLEDEGAAGLRKIQLQPLVPVKPMLAGGVVDETLRYPVWVERKYDGIRLMLHRSSDVHGSVLCGAYTRNRGDWLEQIPGLDQSIRAIPAANAILDGELYGTVVDLDGTRPASVYEVYAALQGNPTVPVTLKYAAFDLVYLNGVDLAGQPLAQRRQVLSSLLAPLTSRQLPIPLSLSDGQLATSREDANRLFQHFRAQGYEGIITKDLQAPYQFDVRDPGWRKRKPQVTLDLVLLGACMAVTEKQTAGAFGSYVIGARTTEQEFEVVGDVAGVDRERDAQIQAEIMRSGLLTGRRIERASASGVRPGFELRPSIVVTVKFEGVIRDQATGRLSLRDPKIALIRSDKSAVEADSLEALRELYLRQRMR